ncbi:TonB-dependent receptor domain-containing protein, partial [Candidatus Symbiopectobacterium endolongispinus]
QMIESQQAQTLGDVVKNDASVQSVRGYGNFAEAYRIRGFKLDGDDITMSGLFGVMPRQIVSTNMIDRVEILKGSNAFLNGVYAGCSGVGGSVNVGPKHADDVPLTRATIDYTSSSQVGGALDIGRRFVDDNRFGVRVNLLHREGEAAIDDQRERVSLAAVGLDYRGDCFRTSLDAGYQHQYLHGGRLGINVSATGLQAIPELPTNTHNYSQRWVYTDMKSRFGMLRGEYDLDNHWTLYSGLGMSNTEEIGNYSTPKLTAAGDGSATWLDATLTKTRAGANDGNDVVGTPGYQLVFGSEYDVPSVEGLTLSGTVLRYGSQYANEANTLKLKPWTRLDLGVRYSMPLNDHTLVWRANVENVTNEKYWASVDDTGTYVTQGDPRSLRLSVSVDF